MRCGACSDVRVEGGGRVSWLFWFLIAFQVLGAVLAVSIVGRPREPMTPGAAAFTVFFNAVMILLIVLGWPR